MTILMQLVPLRRDDMLKCDMLNVSQVVGIQSTTKLGFVTGFK